MSIKKKSPPNPPPFVCPECRSSGFLPSKTGKGCTFCDGTEGGVGPDSGNPPPSLPDNHVGHAATGTILDKASAILVLLAHHGVKVDPDLMLALHAIGDIMAVMYCAPERHDEQKALLNLTRQRLFTAGAWVQKKVGPGVSGNLLDFVACVNMVAAAETEEDREQNFRKANQWWILTFGTDMPLFVEWRKRAFELEESKIEAGEETKPQRQQEEPPEPPSNVVPIRGKKGTVLH